MVNPKRLPGNEELYWGDELREVEAEKRQVFRDAREDFTGLTFDRRIVDDAA